MAKKKPSADKYRILIASNNLGKMDYVRSLISKELAKIYGQNPPVEVFAVKSPKRAIKILSADTVMLVVDYQFSNSSGKWSAFKVVRKAQRRNKNVSVVVVTKPKDKRLYDKQQPFAYLALGNSPKRKRKFKKEMREQLNAVFGTSN